MNSSLAPLGPRVRNSLITTDGKSSGDGVGEGEPPGLGDGDGCGIGVGVGVGAGVGLGLGLGVGMGVGVGVGCVTVTCDDVDCTPRATAVTCAVPGPIAFANPRPSTNTTEV